MNKPTITPGSRITLHYTLHQEDGTLIEDTHDDDGPLEITLGEGSLPEGLEGYLLGLSDGDERTFKLAPNEAYGWPDSDAIHVLPRTEFDSELKLAPGLILNFSAPNGDHLPGTIQQIDENHIHVDFNHPLAGCTLQVSIEILTIHPA